MFRRLVACVALASTLVPVLACGHDPSHVRLATTTSVENSGLLAAILPQFQASTGIQVDVMPVGSGRALVLLERGDADVGLTHDPDAEQRALDAGHINGYRKLMFNDFVLVGPAHDPAKVRGARTLCRPSGNCGIRPWSLSPAAINPALPCAKNNCGWAQAGVQWVNAF